MAHEHDLAVVDDVYLDWMGLAEPVRHLHFEPAPGAFPGLRVTLRIRTPAIEGLIAGMRVGPPAWRSKNQSTRTACYV